MIREPERLLAHLQRIHAAIRAAVVDACEATAVEQLAAPVGFEGGDTIYAIDRVSEHALLAQFAALAAEWSCVLIAEGLGADGKLVLPTGIRAEDAELRIIVDPIDGTRGLMYQKRSAWILTGVAPNRGDTTTLQDIELGLMTEIPLVKQHLSDSFWAIMGQGAHGERVNRLTGSRTTLQPRPSQAATIAQGYGGISRFFPGGRATLAAIDDAIVEQVLGAPPPGVALAFEDQYVCSGGQLYELMMGHDRWLADLRPLLNTPGKLCCHPYDLCTELVAREAGVVVTNPFGAPLDAPLDVGTNIAWLGCANSQIASQIGPALRAQLLAHGLNRTHP
jgi:fructose-1,6-bisphosphatase/inositol monophosphatase family enzyme